MSMISDLVGRMEGLLMELKKMYGNGWDYGNEIKTVDEAIAAIKDLSAKLSTANMERSSQYYNSGWIPVLEERFPKSGERVLVSFDNYPELCVSKYKEDEMGGAFYLGDESESMVTAGLFVSAWMPLPEPYKED